MKHKAEIDKWVREKVEKGKVGDIIGLILTLMGGQLDSETDNGSEAMPVFSSFPGNLAEEITYDQLVFDNAPTHQESSQVLQYIKYLSSVQAYILALRYVVGYDQSEIAKSLGCSRQNVTKEEKRIRSILRMNLTKKGGRNARN